MNLLHFNLEEVLSKSNIGVTELANRLSVSRQTVYYYAKQGDKLPLNTINEILLAIGDDLPENNSVGILCPNCGAELEIKKKDK